jgi:hypothetical protein
MTTVAISLSILVSAAASPATTSLQHVCSWKRLPSADPHARWYDALESVSVVSAHEGWAVGQYYTGREGGPNGTVLERWNGTRWRPTKLSMARGSTLWSVSASGSSDAWAVGSAYSGGPLMEHWDGRSWSRVQLPRVAAPILHGVAARTSKDAWAVGAYEQHGAGKTLAEHWDGRRWTVVPTPNPGAAPSRQPYALLQAVTVISANDVWAAGYSGVRKPTPTARPLIEHWNGRRWTIAPTPAVRSGRVLNDILFSISGSGGDVWAVGSRGSVAGGYGGRGDHPLALHWDGSAWRRIPTPAMSHRAIFYGVVAGTGTAWAVGDRGVQPRQRPLIERWDGRRLSPVASPAGFSLDGVAASPDGTVWAVGADGRRPLAARC